MADFEPAFTKVLGREGGWVNHPNDPGGETVYGVSRKAHPDWRGWRIVDKRHPTKRERAALLPLAKKLYMEKYWKPLRLDDIRHQALAERMFDIGVNQGRKTAAEYLQDGLNMFNRNGADYPDIAVDGVIGYRTLAALDGYYARRQERGIRMLVEWLKFCQRERYVALARRNRSMESFFYGWWTRAMEDDYGEDEDGADIA